MRGLALALCLGLAASPAKSDSVEDLVTRLLSVPPEASQFSSAFLTAVPLPQLADLLEGLRATIGRVTDVQISGEVMLVTTASHRLRGQIGLDADGRIALLFFEPPEPRPADLDAALAAIRALGTDTSWLVTRDGTDLARQAADRPMGVGSAFKLGVLAVLVQDVQSGLRRWDDVVVLDEADLSLPSGILQDHPPGAPLTLHGAAALMISISDNTATDLLIRTLGRDRIAEVLGLAPLLTTREFFALKADSAAAAAFLAAAPEKRAGLAAAAAETLPMASQVTGPYTSGIEWEVPLDRLCALALPLADLPLMAINPGPVAAEDWDRVAYKGGSSPGVLNFTAVLRDSRGQSLCVAITVNSDREVDLAAAVAAFRGLLGVLSDPG